MVVEVDEPVAETVGLREAASLLGISPAGVRKRLLRGQLSATKNAQGEWVIDRKLLERLSPSVSRPSPNGPAVADEPTPDVSRDRLVTMLEQENARLWAELERRATEWQTRLDAERRSRDEELERRAEEMRRKDIMLAEFARAIAELKSRLPELPSGMIADQEVPDTPRAQLSWWRRLLYGPEQ